MLKGQHRIILLWNNISHRPPVAEWGTRALLLSCIFLASSVQFGCAMYTLKEFIPVETRAPVTLFERYTLRIIASKERIVNELSLHIDYIEPASDTIPLNSLPIFVIDSMYFEGICMDSLLCVTPMRHYDLFCALQRFDLIDSMAAYDIWRRDKQYSPAGYALRNISWWPKACDNQNIFITIHARLLNRTSGQAIAQESKRIEYFVKKSSGYGIED